MAFDQTIADRICEHLAAGKSLRKAAEAEAMSPRTVLDWVDANPAFSAQYTRVRMRAYEMLAEEIIEISDDSAGDTMVDDDGNVRTDAERVARSKLRVDTRKWMLSKMLPKVYGDKLEMTVEVNDRASVLRKKREERLAGRSTG